MTDERSEEPDFFHRVVTAAVMSVTTQDIVTGVPLCISFLCGVTAEISTYMLLLGLLQTSLLLLRSTTDFQLFVYGNVDFNNNCRNGQELSSV